MGRDYQPKIIFGIKLSSKQIMETIYTSVNDCICKPKSDPNLLQSSNYCQKCGKALHRSTKKVVPKFDGFEDPENGEDLNIGGWPVAIDTEATNFYVGFYVKEGIYGDYGEVKCDLPDMSKMEQFKSDMKKIGLWDEEMFGAWIVLYLSC